jgi:cytochrome c oxidase assembly protein subunit 15
VWQLLASWTVTSHLLTGNAFALGLAFTTQRLFRLSAPPPAREPTTALTRAAVSLAAVLMLLQIVVGGLVSSTYAGLACSEWPACNEGVWFPGFSGAIGTHLLHRLLAYALLAVLISCAWLGRSCDGLRGWLWLACAIGVAQVAAGVANVLLRLPIEVTGLHSALAAALVLSLALAFDEAWRRGRVRQ